MKIKGYEVTEEQQVACRAAMDGRFRTSDIQAAAETAGVPAAGGVSFRVAGAMVRKERAGLSMNGDRSWSWRNS